MRERWAGLKKWQRWSIYGVSTLIVLSVIGAAFGGGDGSEKPYTDEEAAALIDSATRDRTPTSPVGTTPAPAPTAAERAAERRAAAAEARRVKAAVAREKKVAAARARARAQAAARARAQRERVLRGTLVEGSGAKVVTINLSDNGPLIIESSHNGGGNYIVELVGNGLNELMVNEIGSYSGTVALDQVLAGRYRVSIQADGSWSLRYRQPRPQGGEQSLLRTFQGSGPQVIAVQTPEDLEPIITASNSGNANFIVSLIGYGDEVSGSELLFNEIGPYRGETLTSIPSGDYLLSIDAAGSWTIRFQR
jgi:hypothetical protein